MSAQQRSTDPSSSEERAGHSADPSSSAEPASRADSSPSAEVAVRPVDDLVTADRSRSLVDASLVYRIEREQLQIRVRALERELTASERRRQAVIDQYERVLAEREERLREARETPGPEATGDQSAPDPVGRLFALVRP